MSFTTSRKDIVINDSMPSKLFIKKHSDFIAKYGEDKDEYEHIMTEYLRMSGIYWGLTAMDIMGELDRMNKRDIIYFIQECQDQNTGGFSASIGHDPHLLYTLSAIQILTIYNALESIDTNRVTEYIKSLQQPDGSFFGDKWGEVDTRFSFCAIMSLSLLGKLHDNIIDLEKAVEFVLKCQNFDGGFGSKPGSESHAGLIYCCVGFLAITDRLNLIDADILSWWLCERQLPSGGLNGRPEKLPDVCYSWWVLASLAMLGRLHWLSATPLRRFILASQDDETGGFADRPGDIADPFHTLFGLAALSLLSSEEPSADSGGSDAQSSQLEPIEPAYCLTKRALRNAGIRCPEKPAARF